MPNRAQRRAAERQAQKLAVNANKTNAVGQALSPAGPDLQSADAVQSRGTTCTNAMQPHSTTCTQTMSASAGGGSDQPPPPDTFNFQDLIDEIKAKETSEARRNANRANAQHSTGPRTEEGKAKSSMNAVKTGLTGRTVLLPTDDIHAYYDHLDRHFAEFSPATDKEKALTQTIADTEWRLLRIAPLESGIIAVGRRKLADLFPEEKDPSNRQALIDAEIFMTFRRDFSNLALQERRLRNQRNTDVAQLGQLQKDRRDKHAADLKRALALYKSTRKLNVPFEPAFFGFVFSVEELEDHIRREQANAFVEGQPSDLTKEQFAAYLAEWKGRQAA
jgi:hypothetical protein